MRVTVITHSSTYDGRAEAVGRFFQKRGDQVTWIFSDFDHLKKVTRKTEQPDHVYLHMIPYKKNLSAKRIFSIRKFAGDAAEYVQKQAESGDGPDLMYVMLPANTLAEKARRLHDEYGIRVIFDIVDLWPESLPLRHIAALPPVVKWKNLRDQNLCAAEMIFTECGLYRKELALPAEKSRTLYWFKDREDGSEVTEMPAFDYGPEEHDGPAEIAYMGAINNIIDIDLIAELMKETAAICPCHLRVIGEGGHRKDFLSALDRASVPYTWYGAVYDEAEKAKILAPCRAGLNVMKKSVHVGLTMKSIDYMSFGIPLINSIGGDTQALVGRKQIGVNIDRGNIPESAASVAWLLGSDPSDTRRRVLGIFNRYFTRGAFEATLAESIHT